MSNFAEGHDHTWYLRLVDLAEDSNSVPLWSQQDLTDVWAHQLAASVTKCIEELSLVHALHCETLCAAASPPVKTIRDLILHPNPDLTVLTMVAKWMERALGDTEELLPREIALALFNLAIVLARTRCDANLIRSADSQLGERAAWVAQRPWIDDVTRILMNDASDRLGGTDSEGSP